jgi:hypothetical protein
VPNCPPKTDADRNRWENVVGKALKDWTTALMGFGMTRKEARVCVLSEIEFQAAAAAARLREKERESHEGISI